MPFLGVQPAETALTGGQIADDVIDSEHYAAGSIDTAHIATNQIDGTLTKDALIADYSDVTITASDLIMYGDATDSNNTKRDTVQGVLDLAGGGAWNIIGTDEAGGGSGQASLDVTGLDSTYDQYAIGLSNVLPINDAVGAYFRFGDSSGVDSGSSDYSLAMEEMSANDDSGAQGYGSDTAAPQMHINLVQSNGSGVGNASTEGIGGMFFLHRPGDAQILPMMSGFFAFVDNNDVEMQCGNMFGSRKSAIVLDRIQFLFSSGNVEVGRMTVWGIAHA